MSKENNSPVFAISKDDKIKTLEDVKSYIQQQVWALAYMQSQYDSLEELPEDATDEQKKARAQERVKIDAKEREVEMQTRFYNFILNHEELS